MRALRLSSCSAISTEPKLHVDKPQVEAQTMGREFIGTSATDVNSRELESLPAHHMMPRSSGGKGYGLYPERSVLPPYIIV